MFLQSRAHLFCSAPCALTTSTSIRSSDLMLSASLLDTQPFYQMCLLLFSPSKWVLPPISGSGAECGDSGCYVKQGGRAGSVHGVCCWGRKIWSVWSEQAAAQRLCPLAIPVGNLLLFVCFIRSATCHQPTKGAACFCRGIAQLP